MTNANPFVAAGYQQTSAKYRTIARLPEGMTGIEALKLADQEAYAHLQERLEREAASTFRRVYAQQLGCQIMLSPEEFVAFKAAGGETSW